MRHRSGPIYYWYEELSTRYLTGALHVDDVVVDDYGELFVKLRGLAAVRNLYGTRIVALGGPWGKYAPEAPEVARSRYRLEIVDVATTISPGARRRPKPTRNSCAPPPAARGATSGFPARSSAPQSRSLGPMAFCESDFVVIPPGILMRHLTGAPVFLHNSTFPHGRMVTCAHCTSPRRMNGRDYEPALITTHYESEYGAAPKVDFPLGQPLSFIDPQYAAPRWAGFRGVVRANPSYEICRSQQDVEIQGDWEAIKAEARDSHWVMAYGDCVEQAGYAARKLGVEWTNLSKSAA